ncbi:N-acetylmuramic acid 6-phosphate etherase [Alteromonas sp. ASW11-130]|uniref:N-acetylmuramic acid 6-phosphate etherase n=1 Tax=Alteromonas sp. ASW11-130 TaxID=3015775 RepID=UPI002241CFF1|nr:N-acetylmuramic acid 6-phosphate etherase [Alteromonas sp. ASW11-130]MCW8092952.1 N-acetylmuramic acid 6-phosphate etherase [Alteromonas sp. ASW11-130]
MASKDLLEQLNQLVSEGRNPNTMDIDMLDSKAILEKINAEDALVANAIKLEIANIAKAVDCIVTSISKQGRLIYIGAGTSGRLGILDAVECRPTFSVDDTLVQGVIAGGERAIQHAVEGAEDDAKQGEQDCEQIDLSEKDVLVGIAASGRTPYVIGALKYAKSIGAKTVGLSCNPATPVVTLADIGICIEVGPECLTGSTRMKSGTAQKMVLNMLSTASMIRLGKAYENLMVDVNATNQKLLARATRIVMQATQCTQQDAENALSESANNAKVAILMLLTQCTAKEAKNKLEHANGFLRKAVEKP